MTDIRNTVCTKVGRPPNRSRKIETATDQRTMLQFLADQTAKIVGIETSSKRALRLAAQDGGAL